MKNKIVASLMIIPIIVTMVGCSGDTKESIEDRKTRCVSEMIALNGVITSQECLRLIGDGSVPLMKSK